MAELTTLEGDAPELLGHGNRNGYRRLGPIRQPVTLGRSFWGRQARKVSNVTRKVVNVAAPVLEFVPGGTTAGKALKSGAGFLKKATATKPTVPGAEPTVKEKFLGGDYQKFLLPALAVAAGLLILSRRKSSPSKG